MVSRSYLLAVIFISIQGSCGEIVMTQSPDYISASPGDTVTVSCTASEAVYNTIAWYQQKSGEGPKLLIIAATTRYTGVPDRFSGVSDGSPYTNYKLTISEATEDDAADYYCQQSSSFPYTFGQKTTVDIKRREDATPSVSIFGPSEEELKTGKATAVCLVNTFYPADAKVAWKADNKDVPSDAVKNSEKMKDADNTYSLSSMYSISADEFKKYTTISCVVTHKTLSTAVVKTIKTTEC